MQNVSASSFIELNGEGEWFPLLLFLSLSLCLKPRRSKEAFPGMEITGAEELHLINVYIWPPFTSTGAEPEEKHANL